MVAGKKGQDHKGNNQVIRNTNESPQFSSLVSLQMNMTLRVQNKCKIYLKSLRNPTPVMDSKRYQ